MFTWYCNTCKDYHFKFTRKYSRVECNGIINGKLVLKTIYTCKKPIPGPKVGEPGAEIKLWG